MTDRALLRVIRWCLHGLSDRAAWRHFQIERSFWVSARGMALIARLERGG